MQATRRVCRADGMTEKTDRKLIATGITGTVIAALCCFTPMLVMLFGAVGLSAWLGWLDYVLLPALAFFAALTVYAVWRRQRRQTTRTDG
ncbi:Membrane transport protein MerF [Roseibium aggregatum]|jgi:mercuric ion transport protein|uniref:Membrane transport protein MerF n=2 Tax=Roseibium aggregatum TaxID=187304 RepID=A0A0M6YDA9_9HYPH|nr:Membrane transport protein MerF [Roseibium aggregatum]